MNPGATEPVVVDTVATGAEMVQVDDEAAFRAAVAEHGPLVPITVAAEFWEVTRKTVWNRVRRGTLQGFLFHGWFFVALGNGLHKRGTRRIGATH